MKFSILAILLLSMSLIGTGLSLTPLNDKIEGSIPSLRKGHFATKDQFKKYIREKQ